MEMSGKGYFRGYASVFNSPDLSNDIIMPGAFKQSLLRRGVRRIKMLYQHDANKIIGVWNKIEEDSYGLYVEGVLLLDVVRAGETYALLQAGALDGLSIGFRTMRSQSSRLNYRMVQEIDLAEISIVTFPMHPEARVAGVLAGKTATHTTEHPYLNLADGIRQATENLNRINPN